MVLWIRGTGLYFRKLEEAEEQYSVYGPREWRSIMLKDEKWRKENRQSLL
jgi:hypothetical protein